MTKTIYAVFMGVLAAITINFAIQTFYPVENYPEYPAELQMVSGDLTSSQQVAQKQYDSKVADYNKSSDTHSQRSLAIALAASLVLIAVGIFCSSGKFSPLYNGAAVGGLVLLYLTFIPNPYIVSSRFNFYAVLISLLVVKGIGLLKFGKLDSSNATKE